jgi:hypothetical protein
MLRSTTLSLRRRTAWRDLLHPLPIAARQREWLKRDVVETNEEILRRPYYKFKSVAATKDGTQAKRDATLANPLAIGPQLPENTLPRDVRRLRHAYSESWDAIPVHSPGRQGH